MLTEILSDSFKCFVCKQIGHMAKNCKTNEQRHSQTPQVGDNTTVVESFETASQDQFSKPAPSLSSMELTSVITPDNVKDVHEKEIITLEPQALKADSKRQHPTTKTTVFLNFSLNLDPDFDTETETELDSESVSISESEDLKKFPASPFDNPAKDQHRET